MSSLPSDKDRCPCALRFAQVGAHVNAQLHTLRGSLQDISSLAQNQCQQWLISIKSRDKEGYLLQNCDMMSEMSRCADSEGRV